MEKSIRVIIIDDHTIIRDALRSYFEDDDTIEIVAEAVNGKDGLDKIGAHQPDLVLTDISMPVLDGHELLKRSKEEFPEVKVIALTMINESQSIKKMLSMDVDGYVLKNSEKEELKTGIIQTVKGEKYYSPHVMHKIMEGFTKRENSDNTVVEMPLSSREKEVLKLILKEYSNAEIAEELFISVRTVDAHKRNLLEKTGSKNLVGLVIYAMEKNIV